MPGLHLHSGNRLELLADALADVVRAPLSSPLREEIVLVQSLGMARWLKLELAERLGVAAGLRFPFPRALALELFRAAGVDTDQQPSFDPQTLTWRIFSLLPGLAEQPAFEPVARYLAGGDGRKRFQLAAKLATVFDQYLTYRPEMIRSWETAKNGAKTAGKKPVTGLADEDEWQPILWRAVCKDWGDGHPALWRETFLKAAKAGRIDRDRLPERLSVFGVSALPPFHLDLLIALSALVPVHLFQLQPTLHYSGDLVSHRQQARLRRRGPFLGENSAEEIAGHRLIASLGRTGREFLKLIYEHDTIEEADHFTDPASPPALVAESVETTSEEGSSESVLPDSIEVTRPSPSLIAVLQRDLLELRSRAADEPKRAISAHDDSIRLHSCHSPVREAEVLRDHLLKWFTEDPSLQPRDIVVMVPDLETYAAAIEAALGAPERPEEAIPFTIADRSPRDAGALAALWQALELVRGRFAAPEVVALLECDSVRRRFSFEPDDFELVRQWITDAEIRLGLGAESIGEFHGEPLNTWAAGLQRLVAGYCVAGRGDVAVLEVVRPCAVEGADALVLGRLCEAVDRLGQAASTFAQPATPSAWADRLRDFADTLLGIDSLAPREQETLRAAAESLRQAETNATCSIELDLTTVLEHLGPSLSEDRHGSGYLAGAITICGLKPMRSIPFQIVCLLGMNDGAFPRRNIPLGFDLTTRDRRIGDSSPRDDDRQLFLETVVSVRRRLHLSFVGQSQHHGKAAPPSVVVGELLDALDHEFTGPDGSPLRDHLVVTHKLQAFSPAYFTGGPLFSFSRSNFYAARQSTELRTRPKPALQGEFGEADADLRDVALDDLVRFFTNPPRWFAERRLKLQLPGRSDVLADAERFDTGPLDEYGAKSALLEILVATATSPPLRVRSRERETVPLQARANPRIRQSSPVPSESPVVPPTSDEPEESKEPTAETPSFETAAPQNTTGPDLENAAPAPERTAEETIPSTPVPPVGSSPAAVPACGMNALDPATLAIAHELLAQWRRAGRLPAGLVGLSDARRLANETVHFWSHAAAHIGRGPIRQIERTLALGDFSLTGTITLRGRALTRIRPAKVKAKDRIRAWLEHLFALVASGEPIRTVFIGLDETVEFGAVAEPAAVLQGLLDLFWIGQTGALPFMPETAHAYVASLQKYPEDADRALLAARQRWLGDDTGFGPPGESLDPACQLAFTDRNLTEEPGFLELTAAVFRVMALHGKDSSR
jgi:exodeoxyribonuclease V gamma subunit